MRIDHILLAGTASLALAAPAQAADHWYLNVSASGNWLDHSDFSAAAPGPDVFSVVSDADKGWIVAAALGMSLSHWPPGLRVDIEGSYRDNQLDGTFSSSAPLGSNSGMIEHDHTAVALLVNVWWDFDVGGVKPYIGASLGWADVEIDGTFTCATAVGICGVAGPEIPFSVSDDGFAWQGGAGVNIPISPNIQLGFGYRYFEGPELTLSPPDTVRNQAAGELEYRSHSATFSLIFGM